MLKVQEKKQSKGEKEVNKSYSAEDMAWLVIGGGIILYSIPTTFPALSFLTLEYMYSLALKGVAGYGFFLVFDGIKNKIINKEEN